MLEFTLFYVVFVEIPTQLGMHEVKLGRSACFGCFV